MTCVKDLLANVALMGLFFFHILHFIFFLFFFPYMALSLQDSPANVAVIGLVVLYRSSNELFPNAVIMMQNIISQTQINVLFVGSVHTQHVKCSCGSKTFELIRTLS